MESQVAHPYGRRHEQEFHMRGHQTEGEQEHQDEKKSVLKKVKAKAKKIKNTLTKHGHGPNHDHIPDDHDVVEEDAEEEKIVEDPEIHGARAIKSFGQVEKNSGQFGVNAGRLTARDVDPLNLRHNVRPGAGSHIHEQEERKVHPEVNLGLTSVLGEVPDAPQNTPVAYTAAETCHTRNDIPTRTLLPGQVEHPGQPKVDLQRPKCLEEDPAAPKDTPGAFISSNYQSKVTETTERGGEEVGINSILGSMDKMNIQGESKPTSGQQQNWPTETEDFYTSVPTGTFAVGQEERPGQPEVNLQRPKGLEEDPAAPKDTLGACISSNYESEVTDPTERGGEEVGINSALDSMNKMNIQRESKPTSGQQQNWPTGTEDFYTSVPGQEEHLGQPKVNLQRPKGLVENPAASKDTPGVYISSNYQSKVTDPTGGGAEEVGINSALGSMDKMNIHGESKPTSGQHQNWPKGSEDFYTSVPTGTTFVPGQEEHSGQPKVNLQRPKGLEEDLAAPKDTPGTYISSNYQSKVTDSTGGGGEEVGQNSALGSVDKMNIHGELKPMSGQQQNWPTGTEDFYTNVPTGTTFVPGQEEHPGQPKVNLQRPKGLEEDPTAPKDTPGAYISSDYQSKVTDPTGRGGEELGIISVIGSVDKMNIHGESKPTSGQQQNWPTGTEDFYPRVPTGTFVPGQEEHPGQPKVNLQRPKGLEEDPTAAKDTPAAYISSNYQSKVADPTGRGGEEVGIASVIGSVDEINIHGEPKPTSGQQQNWPTRTEDFYASVPTGTFLPGQEDHPGQSKVNLQRPKGLEEDPAAPKDTPGAHISSNYQSKVTDPTGRVGEEVGITSVIGSVDKMNVHGQSKPTSGQQNWPTGTENSYTSMPTGSHDQFTRELTPPTPLTTEQASDTPQEHPHDNSADTKKQSNQCSYTEKISSATSVISHKAMSAKNVVASKLGYGERENTGGFEMHGGDKSSSPASAIDYGKKIAATVREKLTPVYENVSGAGSNIMSKMPSTKTGSDIGKERDVGGQDKGVSVKGYLAEKLRPGEEDRALSEVISQALHRKKAEQQNKSTSSRPVTETISDALYKVKEEPDEAIDKPVGTVTESEEVARRWGSTKHDSSTENMDSIYANTSGKGVVDKIKGAVGSLFSKGEERGGSQQSFNSSIASAFEEARNDSSSATGERKLQASAN